VVIVLLCYAANSEAQLLEYRNGIATQRN